MKNPGWILFMFITLLSCRTWADSLELYFYKSPHGLNWESPRSILVSTLKSYLTSQSHPIGHVHVKLKCDSQNWEIHTGMTTKNANDEYNVLLKDQIGLGVVFYNFEGKLEENNSVKAELLNEIKGDRINFLKLLISHTTCERLKNYYLEYKFSNYGNNYGLSNRPLYREGAGCTAFAQSFLQVAGFAGFSFSYSWKKKIRVPDLLIGDGINKKVNLLEILLSEAADRWAYDDEAGASIEFWDADTMYDWINILWSRHIPIDVTYKKIMLVNAKGIQVNLQKIPTPQEPIWKN